MPCTYTGSLEGDRILALEERIDGLTDVTNMLCSFCEVYEEMYNRSYTDRYDNCYRGPSLIDSVDGLREWWEKHKAKDAARLARETAIREEKARKTQLAREGLKKLTDEEKKALGLN